MRRLLVTLILGVFLASAAGCADLGISNPFESTPTAASSQLLGISLPAGMENGIARPCPTADVAAATRPEEK